MMNWSRREVLGALVAGAGLPALGHAGTAPRKVGIVGGGMAGVSLAWLLDGEREVVLLEAGDAVGGNVQTIDVDVEGQTYPVDVGAQYFHPALYPTYVKVLTLLGLYPPDGSGTRSHSFPASITMSVPFQPPPKFVSPIFPDRVWPILAQWNQAGIQAFAVAFAAAKAREQANESWLLTLGAWLPTLGLTQAQWEGMVLPWVASLYSGNVEETRNLSARAAMIFAATALPDRATDPILYYVLDHGMAEPLRRMIDQFTTVTVHTGARVTSIVREAAGFRVFRDGGPSLFVDDLVFASSGPATLQLLQGLPGTASQQAALQAIEFRDAVLAIHRDPILVTNPGVWSFFNCELENGSCEASMWLAKVIPGAPSLWKSWVTHRERQPVDVVHQSSFKHLLPTPASLVAQAVVRSLQGQGGVWFAGGYTFPFDSQETALVSALQVAVGLQATSARGRALAAASAS